jgi:hypothetical protein
MIPISSGARVWLVTGHTDMRKGFDGLALIVQETLRRTRIPVLIPEEAAPQFLDDAAPRNGMMPPPDSWMIAPPITE